ncbi:MAG: branched-chain amino acid ABC transporter permease [Desulfitobacteriaceae bacterium]
MTGKNGNRKDPLIAILAGLGLCFLLYAALISSLVIALLILAVGLGLVVFSEHRGSIERVYTAVGSNKVLVLAVIGLFVLVLPFLLQGNSYLLHILVIAGIYSIVALGLNFQVGSTGMVNFAPAAFFGTGAYTSALLSVKLGFSPWLGTLSGIIMAAALGIVFGFPALKTKGYYLSLVTIAMQVIFTLMIINTDALGGPNGVPGIPAYKITGHSLRTTLDIFGISLPYQANYIYLIYIILALVSLIAYRLYNSRTGLAWNAIEQDEIVAVTQGINLTRQKLLAFALGAAFAGLAGALYGHYTSFIGVEDFDFSKSLILICMVLLGGMDNVPGVILGAILLTIIDEKLRDFADYRMLMYSVILILILLTRSQGILPKRNRKYPVPLLLRSQEPGVRIIFGIRIKG